VVPSSARFIAAFALAVGGCAAVTGLSDYAIEDVALQEAGARDAATGADARVTDGSSVSPSPDADATVGPTDASTSKPVDDAAPPDAGADSSVASCLELGSIKHCGACFAACPSDSTTCESGRCYATLRIRVGIDGASVFRFAGAQAYWRHIDAAAPGRHAATPEPLQLNGQSYAPTWPDDGGDTLNYDCSCDSSMMTVPSAPLPARAQTVTLQVVSARDTIEIAEQPSAANSYRLAVRFADLKNPSSAYYEAVLKYETR